jgi:hypothetical protein
MNDPTTERRHVLVVGGMYVAHTRLAEQPGTTTTLLTLRSKLKPRDLALHHRVVGVADFAGDEPVTMAAAIDSVHRVDAVACFHEPHMSTAARIASALGIPYLREEAIRAVTDKHLMRDLLDRAGLNRVPHAVVTTPEEAETFASGTGYPVIVKPRDGMGSVGVCRVEKDTELAAAMARLRSESPGSDILIERFIEGTEVSVEGFAVNGRHQCIAITQKFKDLQTHVEFGHVVPAPGIGAARREAIHAAVDTALAVLGVTDGPTHTEVIVNDYGVHIVETHVRPGGDYIPECLAYSFGDDFNLIEMSARYAAGRLDGVLGGQPAGVPPRFTAVWFGSADTQGVVASVPQPTTTGLIVRAEVLVEPGDTVRPAQHSFDRTCFAIAVADDPDEALAGARTCVETMVTGIETEA